MFVPNWFTNCEVYPELPSIQGWVEAMTSLGRLIFFDQPGTGASDPVTSGALPTLEQWADSITAVLDDLGSREAVLLAVDGALAPAALFAATHPSRTTALVALEGHAEIRHPTDGFDREEAIASLSSHLAAISRVSRANFQSDGCHRRQCGMVDHVTHRCRISADRSCPLPRRRSGSFGPPVNSTFSTSVQPCTGA